jgi:hypothetical protein
VTTSKRWVLLTVVAGWKGALKELEDPGDWAIRESGDAGITLRASEAKGESLDGNTVSSERASLRRGKRRGQEVFSVLDFLFRSTWFQIHQLVPKPQGTQALHRTASREIPQTRAHGV